MGRLCFMHGRDEKCTQNFGPKAEMLLITWKRGGWEGIIGGKA